MYSGMYLRELPIKVSYSIPRDDIIFDFIVPALLCTDKYDRAAGYFTSESLIRSSAGMCAVAKNGGHIRLLTSPRLTKEDVEAIEEGYDRRFIIEKALVRELVPLNDGDYQGRLELLADLVAFNHLDIKVCFLERKNGTSLFHPKFGILTDSAGDSIYFNGSMNETLNGVMNNWELIDVLKSWTNIENVAAGKELFDRLWNDKEEGVCVIELPSIVKELLLTYRSGKINYDLDSELISSRRKSESKYFRKPSSLSLRQYQKDAIDTWVGNNYRGIFNMATGTGKTITSLAALEILCNLSDNGVFTIIVCPYMHLVEQWTNEIRKFGVEPIIGHSASEQQDWKKNLDSQARIFNRHQSDGLAKSYCFVTTINTFTSSQIQNIINGLKGNVLLVVDEVHNIGTSRSISKLSPNIPYRLGLSATVDRYNDPDGTKAIRDYFGKECINYSLEDAINSGMLVQYKYFPILCVMSSEEYQRFSELNSQMDEIIHQNISQREIDIQLKPIKLLGARLVSSLQSKFESLKTIVENHNQDKHMLVYCGDAKIEDEDVDPEDFDYKVSVVDKVTDLLGNEMDIRVSRFTYRENMNERREILDDFEKGVIQVLVAIRCLDEGVNIPSIRTALITSSGENPKEYIQRRGRILRKYSSKEFGKKEYATLYDFVALPQDLDIVKSTKNKNLLDIAFLKKEVTRMEEFSKICMNPERTVELINSIKLSYGIDDFN